MNLLKNNPTMIATLISGLLILLGWILKFNAQETGATFIFLTLTSDKIISETAIISFSFFTESTGMIIVERGCLTRSLSFFLIEWTREDIFCAYNIFLSNSSEIRFNLDSGKSTKCTDSGPPENKHKSLYKLSEKNGINGDEIIEIVFKHS